jgi:hypothetical protein
VVPKIAGIFEQLVAPGGRLIVLQYPSYTERTLGLHEADDFCRAVLAEVAAALADRFALQRPVLEAGAMFPAQKWWLFSRSRDPSAAKDR